MEQYSAKILDDTGQVIIHGQIKTFLDLTVARTFRICKVDNSVLILQPTERNPSQHVRFIVDTNGRGVMRLPSEIKEALAWPTGSTIAIYHVYEGSLILQLEEKSD